MGDPQPGRFREGLRRTASGLLAPLVRWRCNGPSLPSEVREILIIELGGLGDVLHLDPVLRALRDRYAGARCSVVCRGYVASAFELISGVDRVYGMDKQPGAALALARRLARERFDLVLVTAWSCYAELLLLALRRPFAFAGYLSDYRLESHGCPAACTTEIANDVHLGEIRRAVLRAFGARWPVSGHEAPGLGIELLRPPARLPYGAALMPFCDDAGKSLSLDEAAALLRDLGEALPRPRVLLGGPKEEDLLQALAGRLPAQWREPAGGFSTAMEPRVCRTWTETAHHLLGAEYLLSVDTGVMHLGAALGVPVKALFRSTLPSRCGAIANGATVENYPWPGERARLLNALRRPRLELIPKDACVTPV